MAPSTEPIETPCRKICVLDRSRQFCIGCGRTRQEIAAWVFLSPQERRRIMAQLPERIRTFNQPERQ
ncbi:hypothetical protein HRbin20_00776 [bacterium HR20]|nr:hypothetical protein HRbin20_00776 [bacterium HR20]